MIFFPTRFHPEMATKHLFEIAWNACGTKWKSIFDPVSVLGSPHPHPNPVKGAFSALHFFYVKIARFGAIRPAGILLEYGIPEFWRAFLGRSPSVK